MKNITRFFFSFLTISFSFNSYSQNGPGGVGSTSNLETWLDASRLILSNNDPVTSWTDLSGNNNAAQEVPLQVRPTFLTNQLNSKPVLDFTGLGLLEFNNNITTLETTVFSVHKSPINANATAAFAIANHVVLETTTQIVPVYFNPIQTSFRVNKTRNQFSVMSISSADGISGVNVRVTNDSRFNSGVRNEGAGLTSSTLGCRNQGGYISHFSGQMAEFIVFNEQLNSAKRKIVSNYLAAKYNLTAEQNLYLHNASFGNEVIGIGQEADGNHIESRGMDSLKIENPSSLDNGDYLLVGNNGAGYNTSNSVENDLVQRWAQVWRANVKGTPGTIDVTFYLGNNDFAQNPNDYIVIIENVDGDFANGGTRNHEVGRVYDAVAKTISFTGLSLADGNYFTLGEKLSIPSFNLSFGPGGVGSNTNLETWLDASRLTLADGAIVNDWTDLSGSGNNALGINSLTKPTLQTNQINGNSVVDFTGQAVLKFLSNINTLETTVFSVHKTPTNPNSTAAFAIANHVVLENATHLVPVYFNPIQTSFRINRSRNQFSVMSISSADGVSGVSFRATNDARVNSGNRNEGAGLTSSTLGCRNQSGYINHFSGQMAEFIVFNEQINSAKRNIVSNYLAAKYDLTAEQNLYAHKTTYGTDVIGIGQEADGNHLESRGLDSLLINNPSALGNGDYILVGNDGADFSTSTDVGVLTTQRWNKIWRADVTGTPGTIDLVFYLGNNDFAVDPNNYAVLIENVDGDFGNGGTSVQESGRLYNALTKTLTFTGITLNDGDYFTIAEKGPITAIATGNWEATSTWSCDCVPTASSTVTVPSPFTVSINELANAKSVTINTGGTVTITSNDTLQIVESLNIEGTLNSGAEGTILANGTTDQTFANSSGANIELVNLVANNPTNLFLTGGWSLNNTLQVNVGTLDVSGADSLVLLSNITKTAEILESNGSFVGDFTLQRFIGARNANYSNIAAPISNATVASIDDDVKISGVGGVFGNAWANPGRGIFYSMYQYDRSDDNSLDTIQSTATALTPGVGYELYLFTTLGSFSASTLDYVGTPNFGLVTPPNILSGFNLVGNPYQCHLDRTNLDNSNIGPTIYIFDSSTGAYTTLGASKIAPGQGFWVDNTSGATVPFYFDETDKSATGSSAFLRQKNNKDFTLELSNNVNYFKNTVTIGFDYSATESLDQFDARFLPSPMDNSSELYFTTITEDRLMKNTLNQLEENHVVPMEVKIGEAGTYTINSSNISSILENYSCVYLKDKATEEIVDLSVDQNYTFEAVSGVSERFKLVVSNSFDACDKALNSESTVQKLGNNLKLRESYGNWFLDYNLGEEVETVVVSVYGMNGQQVLSKMELNLSENGTHKLDELNNLNGIFLIQIVGSKNILNQTIKL